MDAPSCRWVLAADDPAGLAAFYGALLHQPPVAGQGPSHWLVGLPAGGRLEIYAPARSRRRPRQEGRLALCLQRRAGPEGAGGAMLQAWISEAEAAGARLLEGPRQEPFGWEAWLTDPEDNRLLLLVAA